MDQSPNQGRAIYGVGGTSLSFRRPNAPPSQAAYVTGPVHAGFFSPAKLKLMREAFNEGRVIPRQSLLPLPPPLVASNVLVGSPIRHSSLPRIQANEMQHSSLNDADFEQESSETEPQSFRNSTDGEDAVLVMRMRRVLGKLRHDRQYQVPHYFMDNAGPPRNFAIKASTAVLSVGKKQLSSASSRFRDSELLLEDDVSSPSNRRLIKSVSNLGTSSSLISPRKPKLPPPTDSQPQRPTPSKDTTSPQPPVRERVSEPMPPPPASDDMNNITWPSEGLETKARASLLKRGGSEDTSDWARATAQYSARKGISIAGGGLFVCTNSEVRKALREHGMEEVEDAGYELWDVRFVTNQRDIPYAALHPCQLVNHYEHAASELGSKSGLLRNLRSLCWLDGLDVSTFVPRTYNLQNTWELIKFVDDFIATEAQGVLLKFELGEFSDMSVVAHACGVVNKTISAMTRAGSTVPLGVSIGLSISDLYILNNALWSKHEMSGACPQAAPADPAVDLHKMCAEALAKLRSIKPVDYDGHRNVWICKPGHSSRGRGIRLFDDLVQILKFSMSRKKAVISQKYLETPLLVEEKKFDIRVWVLVTNWNPLTVWCFDPCYMRLTVKKHNFDNLKDPFAHLCNRCVQTKSGEYCGEEEEADSDNDDPTQIHMWDAPQFKAYMDKEYGEEKNVWGEVWEKVKMVIVRTLHSVQDAMDPFNRRNSFEWFGFDVMIDRNFAAWLVEVNISPDTACCTDVLRTVVPAAASDLVSLFLSGNEPCPTSAGGGGKWTLLYKGKTHSAVSLRQRSSYAKVKSSEMRSGCPFSTRESLIQKLGLPLYNHIIKSDPP